MSRVGSMGVSFFDLSRTESTTPVSLLPNFERFAESIENVAFVAAAEVLSKVADSPFFVVSFRLATEVRRHPLTAKGCFDPVEKSSAFGSILAAYGLGEKCRVSLVLCSAPVLDTANTEYAGWARQRRSSPLNVTVAFVESPLTATVPSTVAVSAASFEFLSFSFAALFRFFPVSVQVMEGGRGFVNVTLPLSSAPGQLRSEIESSSWLWSIT